MCTELCQRDVAGEQRPGLTPIGAIIVLNLAERSATDRSGSAVSPSAIDRCAIAPARIVFHAIRRVGDHKVRLTASWVGDHSQTTFSDFWFAIRPSAVPGAIDYATGRGWGYRKSGGTTPCTAKLPDDSPPRMAACANVFRKLRMWSRLESVSLLYNSSA
jgi:hypothetical protein